MTNSTRARFFASFSPFPQQLVLARYSIALATSVLAILFRGVLDPLLGHVAFYATLYMAVAFVAVICGVAPAILSAMVGFLGIFYWFVDPRYSLLVVRPSEVHGIIGCFLVCLVLVTLGGTNRQKQLRLNGIIAALTAEGAEKQRVEEELRDTQEGLERRVEERTLALSKALMRLQSEVSVRERAQEQMRLLSIRLMTTQDEERRRIARELHDSAGQKLAAIKMGLAAPEFLDPRKPDCTRQLGDISTLVDEAIQEIRTTSYLLHPPMLDEVGIAFAARWFVDGFSQRSGIEMNCDVVELCERPPRQCELVLFRILQESLTNVHRHSGATVATVKLSVDADHILLAISDNGHGMSQERVDRFTKTASVGVGIAGMRARVHELGGSMEIVSNHNGTTVAARVPVGQRSPSDAYSASAI
jgi:signal transduction histidine kinase